MNYCVCSPYIFSDFIQFVQLTDFLDFQWMYSLCTRRKLFDYNFRSKIIIPDNFRLIYLTPNYEIWLQTTIFSIFPWTLLFYLDSFRLQRLFITLVMVLSYFLKIATPFPLSIVTFFKNCNYPKNFIGNEYITKTSHYQWTLYFQCISYISIDFNPSTYNRFISSLYPQFNLYTNKFIQWLNSSQEFWCCPAEVLKSSLWTTTWQSFLESACCRTRGRQHSRTKTSCISSSNLLRRGCLFPMVYIL